MNHRKRRGTIPEECQWPVEADLVYKRRLPEIVDSIIENCRTQKAIQHLDSTVMPSRDSIIELLGDMESILFPGYIGRNEVESANLIYYIGELVNKVFDELSVQIMRCIRHECLHSDTGICQHCVERAQEISLELLREIPKLRDLLAEDVQAAFEGDPAAQSVDEIIFSYPGMKAVTIYRIAHELWLREVPILPRIMSEYAHTVTGVDIHPGATIGRSFFIDHGTGVVIGETAKIGNHVQLYQGVTLGALRIPRNSKGELDRTTQRHPTIQDHVTIYAGTTILGGETIIGEGSVVGGNIWLTHSIPSDTKVVMPAPKVEVRTRNKKEEDEPDYSI